MERDTPYTLEYSYWTAAEPLSAQAMATMSQRFPSLRFHCEFKEPLMGFRGHRTAEAGINTAYERGEMDPDELEE